MQVVQDSAQTKAALSTRIHEPRPALSSPYADCKVLCRNAAVVGYLKKERSFFETRVIEYQTGGVLRWD